MKTFSIYTLGCKVNQYESQQIRQFLLARGLSVSPPGQPADIVVVNSCCVTGRASAKSRQAVRRFRRLNPSATVVLAGCLAAGVSQELDNLGDTVRIVGDKTDLPKELEAIFNPADEYDSSKPSEPDKIKEKNEIHIESGLSVRGEPAMPEVLTDYEGQCRAFLKVQDGCDARCSYCIIPLIRGSVCNKGVKLVIQEAENLVRAGHREIVLTGIFLGAYGQSTTRREHWTSGRDGLAEMVMKVAAVPGLERLRLSSLEPGDVTDRLLEVFASCPNVMPHLHLPLQSGSNRILRRMCRQYRLEEFFEAIEKASAVLDRPAITTDMIVGFPGETEEDFELTMEAAGRAGFAKIHVFSFSVRKGTAAAKMSPRVSPEAIRDRAKRLGALDRRLQERFRRQFIGRQVSVLVESLRPMQGRCERYFMVRLDKSDLRRRIRRGDIVPVTLQD